MNNENNIELEQLLRESLKEEFILDEKLDKKTWERMQKKTEVKENSLVIVLSTISLILLGMWFIFFWHLFPQLLAKIILLSISFSSLGSLIFFYIINYKKNIRKEIWI